MVLGNIAVVLGSGYLSTILTGGDPKKVPIIGDTLANFVKNAGKHGKDDGNDLVVSQISSIREELQQAIRRRDENVTVVSGTSGSGSYTVTAIVVAGLIGYAYIRWKGWKVSDLMWVTKRGLADACNVVGKQLDGVSNTVHVTKKHLAGRIDRVDANLDEAQEIIEGTKDEVTIIHLNLSSFQKELQDVNRTVEIWGSRLSGIEDTQDRTVRATEALVGFSQKLEHGGQNPNIRQVSSFLPALGSSSEQKIKMLPPSPLVSLQTVASVAEPSEGESQENPKVLPSSEGSMRWKLPALGLGFLRSSSNGWKISDLIWVTKRGLADACDVVGKQLDEVSNTVHVTKKHLAGRIYRVDVNLDETQVIIEGTKDEVAIIHLNLKSFQKELQEVNRTVEIWGARLSGIEDTQDCIVRATEALVGFSQKLEHGGQNPNIRQVSSFLPALGSSSEQKIKMLPPSPLVSLQTVASVTEPSEGESQENPKVSPSSEGSMRWKLPGLGLGFLRSSSDV